MVISRHWSIFPSILLLLPGHSSLNISGKRNQWESFSLTFSQGQRYRISWRPRQKSQSQWKRPKVPTHSGEGSTAAQHLHCTCAGKASKVGQRDKRYQLLPYDVQSRSLSGDTELPFPEAWTWYFNNNNGQQQVFWGRWRKKKEKRHPPYSNNIGWGKGSLQLWVHETVYSCIISY